MKRITLLFPFVFSVTMRATYEMEKNDFEIICLTHWGVTPEDRACGPLFTECHQYQIKELYEKWQDCRDDRETFAVWYTKFFGFEEWLMNRVALKKAGEQLYDKLDRDALEKKKNLYKKNMLLRIKKCLKQEKKEEDIPLLKRSSMEFIKGVVDYE